MKEKHHFSAGCCSDPDQIEELTAREIFFGKGDFEGLFKFVDVYLREVVVCPEDQYDIINGRYLELLRRRLRGDIPTGARFMRNFVTQHPEYCHNSVVTSGMAYDLIVKCSQEEWNEELLGTPLPEARR